MCCNESPPTIVTRLPTTNRPLLSILRSSVQLLRRFKVSRVIVKVRFLNYGIMARNLNPNKCSIGVAFSKLADMPRQYIRTGTRGRWTDQQLQGATRAVKEQGLSISAASQRFGIPKTTLYNHCSGEIFT